MLTSLVLTNELLFYSTSISISLVNLTTGVTKIFASSTLPIQNLIQSTKTNLITTQSTWINVWNLTDASIIQSCNTTFAILSICELSNGLLSFGTNNNTVWILDTTNGCTTLNLSGSHVSQVNAVIQMTNGLLVSGGGDVKIWNVTTLTCLRTLLNGVSFVYSLVQLSNDSVASATDRKVIQIWNTTSGVLISSLFGHTNYVNTLLLLSNGLLASGSSDYTIKLWDLSNCKCLNTLMNHTNTVTSLTETKSGTLISGSFDNTVKIWGNQ